MFLRHQFKAFINIVTDAAMCISQRNDVTLPELLIERKVLSQGRPETLFQWIAEGQQTRAIHKALLYRSALSDREKGPPPLSQGQGSMRPPP